MNTYLYLIPVISAICGALITIIVRKKIIGKVPALVSELADPNAFHHIQPSIETHIDDFLRHKLSKAMPMISMFIGDKTIAQLKTIFMKEMEEMFPEIINKYTGNLTPVIHSTLKKQLRCLPVTGAATGLIIGIIQLLVILPLI